MASHTWSCRFHITMASGREYRTPWQQIAAFGDDPESIRRDAWSRAWAHYSNQESFLVFAPDTSLRMGRVFTYQIELLQMEVSEGSEDVQ